MMEAPVYIPNLRYLSDAERLLRVDKTLESRRQ